MAGGDLCQWDLFGDSRFSEVIKELPDSCQSHWSDWRESVVREMQTRRRTTHCPLEGAVEEAQSRMLSEIQRRREKGVGRRRRRRAVAETDRDTQTHT